VIANVPSARRALLAGSVCLMILGGMLAGHAWPLWTGQTVMMKAVPVDPRDLFRGEYVRLATPANRLVLSGQGEPNSTEVRVRAIDDVFEVSRAGSIVYVQLEPSPSGDHTARSVSRTRVPGALNLRGRVTFRDSDTVTLRVEYGLDAYYVQEGMGKGIEDAIRDGRNVQMQVAIAASGRSRIRTLVIDGVPLAR
jgi:uncharacterized membrane-anchored protein